MHSASFRDSHQQHWRRPKLLTFSHHNTLRHFIQVFITACPQTSTRNEATLKKRKAILETQSRVYRTWLLFPKLILTSTKVPTATANFAMQEHALRRHLGVKSCLDVIHKGLAVRAVHPDALPKGVLNVNLQEKKPQRTQTVLKLFCTRLLQEYLSFPSYYLFSTYNCELRN